MKRDDRRKFCTDESRIWFIDDLAGEIKYRSIIFQYIREDFLDKALRIKSKETTDLTKLTIPQENNLTKTFSAIGGVGSILYSEVLQPYTSLKPQGTKIVVLGYNNGQVLVSKLYHKQANQNF